MTIFSHNAQAMLRNGTEPGTEGYREEENELFSHFRATLIW